MKKNITNYIFNAANKTIIFNDYTNIEIEKILQISNVKTAEIIYSPMDFGDSKKRKGNVSENILSLSYDTTSMSNSDPLQIWYDDGVYNAYDLNNYLLVNDNIHYENPFSTHQGQIVNSPSETFWSRLARIGKFRSSGQIYNRTSALITTNGAASQTVDYIQANQKKILYFKEYYMRIEGFYPKIPIFQLNIHRGQKDINGEITNYLLEKNANGHYELHLKFDGDVSIRYPKVNDGTGGYFWTNILSGHYTGSTNDADITLAGFNIIKWWKGYEVEDIC